MSPLITSLGSGSARGFGRALKAFIRKPSITSPANNATNQSSSSLSFTASSFQIVGKATSHSKSDWQIASDSGFSNIVVSTTNDITNKTTWTVTSGLSLDTTYYARVRYKDSSTLISDWSSTITFGIEGYLPPLSNGSVTYYSATTWTVPSRISKIRITAGGSIGGQATQRAQPSGASGGIIITEFNVIPGETFRISDHSGGSAGQFSGAGGGVLSFGLDTGSTLTQSTLWLVSGGGGGAQPYSGGDDTPGGGAGRGGSPEGSPSPINEGNNRGGGYGGTQSSGGTGGDGPQYASPATPGSALLGGNSGGSPLAGGGGSGWYGGGGGGGGNFEGAGGGGSARIQIPTPRSATTPTNQKGGNFGGRYITITY